MLIELIKERESSVVLSSQLYLQNYIFCNSISSIIGQYKMFFLKANGKRTVSYTVLFHLTWLAFDKIINLYVRRIIM